MQEIFNFIIETASAWGYLGIIILMTLESCFIPFPSEVVMIPTGYLAHKGELDFSLCILSGVFGSVLGALINYYLCFFWGRDFILRYGRFFGITEEKFTKFEVFLIGTANFLLLFVVCFQVSVNTSLCQQAWLK